MGDTFIWNKTTGGSFNTASNWDDTTTGQNPSPTAPGPDDAATIAASGTITGSGTVDTLAVSTPTALTLSALDVSANTISLAGKVSLTKGTDLTAASAFAVSGETDMGAGTSIHVTNGQFDVATNAAILTLSGPSTTVDVESSIGFAINIGATGASTVPVVDVTNGAALTTRTFLTIGANGGGGGLTVTGAGSTVSAGTIFLGDGGTGALRVANGGVVNASGVEVGTTGYGLATRPGSGSIVVDGPSSALNVSGQLSIGGEFDSEQLTDSGSVTIENGAALTVDPTSATQPSAVVGDEAYSTGSLTVTGPGSTATITNGLAVGYYGHGTLNVLNGATVMLEGSAASDGLIAGELQTSQGPTPVYSTGTITVSGSGSQLALAGAPLVIGEDGNATLAIKNGGVVKSGTGSEIGVGTGGSGAVTVSGSGSQWTSTGTLQVGFGGNGETGALTVSAGGTVAIKSAGTVQVGGNGGSGAVTVTGNQSSLSTGALQLGVSGTATMSVTNYGQVKVSSLLVGSASGSGTLSIAGAGSAVTDTGKAEITAGSVALSGGTLGVGGNLQVDAGGGLSGNGTVEAFATINRGTVEAKSGTLKFLSSVGGQGTLQIDNGATLSLGGTVTSGQSLVFAAGNAALDLSDPGAFSAHISGFAAGSVIDLEGTAATGLSFSGHKLMVNEAGGSSLQLTFAGSYTSANFALQSDGKGGSLITYHAAP